MGEIITSRELMEVLSEVRLKHGQRWGDWMYDERALSLVMKSSHDCPGGYDIDLERCGTAKEVLDWLAHMLEKNWMSERRIADLLRAFDDILDLRQLAAEGEIEDIRIHLKDRTFIEEKDPKSINEAFSLRHECNRRQ